MPEDLDLQPVGQSLTGHEDLDLQPVAEDLDLQPVAEPGGTPGKAWMSAAAGAADTVAGVGRGLKVLSDIGPAKPSFARHEAAALRAGTEQIPYDEAMGQLLGERSQQRQRLMLPGATLEEKAGTAAQQAREAAAAMEGSQAVAKGAELVGGMVPYLLTGPAAPGVAGVSTYGTTYEQAFNYYRKQGLDELSARAKADQVAARTGLATGEIFSALPGLGKGAAERMLAKQLQSASPLVQGAVRTLAASAQGSLVMGADSLVRNAQAKQTYRPDMTWGQVLEESAKDALAGGAATGVIHAPLEAARMGAAAIAARGAPAPGPEPLPGPSEFGGEAEIPPPSGQAGPQNAAPGANVAQVSQPTVPESAETLESQVQWLEQGKRPAVLVTPGSPAVRIPEGMGTHDTAAGTFIYDPHRVTAEMIDNAVEQNQVGHLLGYGIPARPEPGTEMGAVVVRGPDGQEKQAVVVDEQNLNSAMAAARAMAGPGDTVGLESGTRIIDERKANAISLRNQPGGVQPEHQAGDESGQATEAGGGDSLRGEAEGAGQAPTKKVKPSRATTMAAERPWDLIDEIEGNLGGKISLKAARAVDPDFQPKGAARKLFAAGGHWGVDDAMGAAENFRQYESADEFLSALQQAADAREANREGLRQEARVAQADEAREAEFTRDAKRARPEGEPLTPKELMPGDTFELNGTKIKVKGFEFDENGEVTHVRLDDGDRYGTQRWPGEEEIHADKGSVVSSAGPEFLEDRPKLSLDFSDEARKARLAAVQLHKLGPGEDTGRWEAIENTYRMAAAALRAVPYTPLKDIALVMIHAVDRSQPTLRGELVDQVFTSRADLRQTMAKLDEAYPPGKYQASLSMGVQPYQPRKGEPSFQAWLRGQKPGGGSAEQLALLETPTAGRLDYLARRVHGKSYADLEDWQQQAIRTAVEQHPDRPWTAPPRPEVQGREQPGGAEGREPADTGEQPEPGAGAAGQAGALSSAATEANPFQSLTDEQLDRRIADAEVTLRSAWKVTGDRYGALYSPELIQRLEAELQLARDEQNRRHLQLLLSAPGGEELLAQHGGDISKVGKLDWDSLRQQRDLDLNRKLAYLDTKAGQQVAEQYGTDPETTALSDEAYQQGELFGAPEAGGDLPGQPAAPGPGAGPGRLPTARELARAALHTLNPEALKAALAKRRKISSIEPRRAPQEIPEFKINGTVINTPVDFVRTLIALVDEDNRVIHSQVLYAGTLDTTVLDARDLLRLKRLYPKAAGFLLSHNHPSGDPRPSDADLRVTARWREMADRVGLTMVDHVITDGQEYYSFEGHGVESVPEPKMAPWENMPRGELQVVDDPIKFGELVKTMRQVNNDTAHIIYLTTRLGVSAIERVRPDVDEIRAAMMKGLGVEGARFLMVDFGPSIDAYQASQAVAQFNASLSGSINAEVSDWAAQGTMSGKTAGWEFLYKPKAGSLAEDVLREEAPTAPTAEERETGVKISQSAAISDRVKAAITQYLYQPRTNAGDDALAAGMVRELGVNVAEQALRDPPVALPGAVWSRLLGQVTRTLAEQERVARQAKDEPAAQALAERQAKLWDDVLPKITNLAQSLQGLNDLVEMSPEGQVARVRRDLDRANGEALSRKQPELTQIKQALDQGKREGVAAVRQDPAVNRAAGAAVDEAVAGSPRVQQAVMAGLIEAWKTAKQEVLAIPGGPQGETAGEVMKGAARERMAAAARIFAGHINGEQPQVGIVEKLMQGLGLTREKAVDLANKLNRQWEDQLAKAKAKVPAQIKQAREQRQAGITPETPTDQVDAAIRAELKALNLKMGDVLRMEAARQDGSGEHVAERIVQASGLQGEAADTLRNVLKNRWDALVTEAQRRTLERMEKAGGVTLSRPMKAAFEKLVELDRLGALTGERFLDVVRRQLKLKQLTQEQAGILRSLVRRAQDRPEGYLRQQAAADVLKFTERLKGAVNWRDVPMAIFYANILSGLTTTAKITFENTNLLLTSTLASLVSRPRNLLHPAEWLTSTVTAYRRGLAKGALQAASTLKTGTVAGIWEQPRTYLLEMKPFGERMEPLNFWKYFGRVVGTAHELTFKPAWEIKQTELAREVARREGLTGQPLQRRVADLLANTEGEVARARGQALGELVGMGHLNRVDLARRTFEILEQHREERMPGSTAVSRDYALRTAYLNEPYGFLGLVATSVRSMLEQGRKQFPLAGTAAKVQVPFTTVIANILNEKLNWTPVGLARAILSHKSGELYGRAIMSSSERAEAYAKAILGTVAIGALGEFFGSHIHGNGPSDPRKRRQLQAAGWIPHSIQFGNKFYSYMNTPAAVGLSVIGNMLDWQRYGKGDEADSVSRLAFAAKATANAIVSQGMLDSVKRIFEALGSESTTEGADKLERLAARTATSFVVPNLVQQVDRIFDPTVYDRTGVDALIKGQIPFVRREGKPALTVLGDPVEVDPFHYWASTLTKDPVLQTLADKQAWIPEPSRQQIVGERRRGQDYFRAMTPDEYYDWVATSGKAIRERLESNLDRIALAEPDEARRLVQKISEEERAKAKPRF